MTVDPTLVAAAVRAARRAGKDVADVSLDAIAAEAGVSRSTVVRRIGGSRQALDDTVRASGVDPGGRPPVRERAVDVTARLIAEHGLAALTMDRVATRVGCSLPSLHEATGGRDALLGAVFERHLPLLDLRPALTGADEPEAVVRAVYRVLVEAFDPEPRVLPALFADAVSRPEGPASQLIRRNAPNVLDGLGAWLASHVEAGRFRPLPVPLLMQLLVGPLVVHLLTRPVLTGVYGTDLPAVDDAVDGFADAFLRAVGVHR